MYGEQVANLLHYTPLYKHTNSRRDCWRAVYAVLSHNSGSDYCNAEIIYIVANIKSQKNNRLPTFFKLSALLFYETLHLLPLGNKAPLVINIQISSRFYNMAYHQHNSQEGFELHSADRKQSVLRLEELPRSILSSNARYISRIHHR